MTADFKLVGIFVGKKRLENYGFPVWMNVIKIIAIIVDNNYYNK